MLFLPIVGIEPATARRFHSEALSYQTLFPYVLVWQGHMAQRGCRWTLIILGFYQAQTVGVDYVFWKNLNRLKNELFHYIYK